MSGSARASATIETRSAIVDSRGGTTGSLVPPEGTREVGVIFTRLASSYSFIEASFVVVCLMSD